MMSGSTISAAHLEAAKKAAVELARLAHLGLAIAHGDGHVIAKTLSKHATVTFAKDHFRELAQKLEEDCKRIDRASASIRRVSKVVSQAQMSAPCMHEWTCLMAKSVMYTAWGAMCDCHLSADNASPDPNDPVWSRFEESWPIVSTRLRGLPRFDFSLARATILSESAKAVEEANATATTTKKNKHLFRTPQIANYVWGEEFSTLDQAKKESKKNLLRKWIKTGRLKAKRTGHGIYEVEESDLDALRSAERGQ